MNKKFSVINQESKKKILEQEVIQERNLYLDFSKKYHQKHGVSGPFDKKFAGDKKKQQEYMSGLSSAWKKHKGGSSEDKKGAKKFDFVKEGQLTESAQKASELASSMIGDGGSPNYCFVTISDDYYFVKDGTKVKYSEAFTEAPVPIKTTPTFGAITFGPFMNIDESKAFSNSIELDELNGPRSIKIEDRMTGLVFQKSLTCILQPTWFEEEVKSEIPPAEIPQDVPMGQVDGEEDDDDDESYEADDDDSDDEQEEGESENEVEDDDEAFLSSDNDEE